MIWVKDLEWMKVFYEMYFNGKVNDLYYNEKKDFKFYFIMFDFGVRLEMMKKGNVIDLFL